MYLIQLVKDSVPKDMFFVQAHHEIYHGYSQALLAEGCQCDLCDSGPCVSALWGNVHTTSARSSEQGWGLGDVCNTTASSELIDAPAIKA